MANCSFNLFIKQTEGIGGASIAAIIIIILIILVIGGAVFYLKKQKMLCFAPHQEDTKETEQEKVSFGIQNTVTNYSIVLLQEALKNNTDVESGKPIIKGSANIDPKNGANSDAKNTS